MTPVAATRPACTRDDTKPPPPTHPSAPSPTTMHPSAQESAPPPDSASPTHHQQSEVRQLGVQQPVSLAPQQQVLELQVPGGRTASTLVCVGSVISARCVERLQLVEVQVPDWKEVATSQGRPRKCRCTLLQGSSPDSLCIQGMPKNSIDAKVLKARAKHQASLKHQNKYQKSKCCFDC